MKHLSNLEARVEELIQQRHNEVVMAAFNWTIKKHNIGIQCGCDYCLRLKGYVFSKRLLQRFKQRWNSDNTVYTDHDEERGELERIAYLKEHVKELKLSKDALKWVDPYMPTPKVYHHTNLH